MTVSALRIAMLVSILWIPETLFSQGVLDTPHTSGIDPLAVIDAPSGVSFGNNGASGFSAAVASSYLETVGIYGMTSTGSFNLLAIVPTSGPNFSITSGDFNGDGQTDFATTDFRTGLVNVILSSGGDTFVSKPFPVGSMPVSIIAVDMDDDGFLDLITPDGSTATAFVLHGDGNGGFPQRSQLNGPTSGVVAVDLNQDGATDLVGSNRFAPSNGLVILYGPIAPDAKRVGFLKAARVENRNSGGTSPQAVFKGDFNGDGFFDIGVVNFSSDKVGILLNDAKGNLSKEPLLLHTVGRLPVAAKAAFLNDDAQLDIVVATSKGQTLEVFLGRGDGTFEENPSVIREGIKLGSAETTMNVATFIGSDQIRRSVVFAVNRINQVGTEDTVEFFVPTALQWPPNAVYDPDE